MKRQEMQNSKSKTIHKPGQADKTHHENSSQFKMSSFASSPKKKKEWKSNMFGNVLHSYGI